MKKPHPRCPCCDRLAVLRVSPVRNGSGKLRMARWWCGGCRKSWGEHWSRRLTTYDDAYSLWLALNRIEPEEAREIDHKNRNGA